MSTKTELQTLLRFLSQDAKIPLPTAMSKIKDLQNAQLTTPEALSRISITNIQAIFQDEKQSKSVLAAAKRISKKRAAGETTSPASKRTKPSTSSSSLATAQANPFLSPASLSPGALEASLTLPTSTLPISSLNEIVIHTNRAPLVLAFAVTLLKYTMPAQPLSSRLSLAQAVVSANSRSKAVSLGLQKGRSAEEDGWGEGQPRVRVMGREVRVLKRWGYEWKMDMSTVKEEEAEGEQQQHPLSGTETGGVKKEEDSTQSTLKHDEEPPPPPPPPSSTNPYPNPDPNPYPETDDPALWGLDLEALRSRSSSTSSSPSSAFTSTTNNLPIHTPQSARAYLLKSFTSSSTSLAATTSSSPKKITAAAITKERTENLSHLLAALDVLFTSWTTTTPIPSTPSTLPPPPPPTAGSTTTTSTSTSDQSHKKEKYRPGISATELDNRAWDWYVAVRPDVASGVGGWGGKGDVALRGILELCRK